MPENRAAKSEARQIAERERITYMQAQEVMRLRHRKVFVGEEEGVRAYLGIGEMFFPYSQVDLPVYSTITLPDGQEVLGYEYGAQGTFTFSDGEERVGWVWPCDKDEETIAHKMTSRQYDLLVRLDKKAYSFFSSELEEQGHDPQAMTITQLYGLVQKTDRM